MQRLQDNVKADSCLTDDDRIRLSNLEAAASRIQRLADSRLAKLHAALKLVSFANVIDVLYHRPLSRLADRFTAGLAQIAA